MPCQTFVDKRVIRVQHVFERTVLTHHALEKQLRLLLERIAEVFIPLRKLHDVGFQLCHLPRLEPLTEEVTDERVGAAIGKHPSHLLFQYRGVVQLSALREVEKRVVGDRAPQKKRQARSQLEVGEAIGTATAINRVSLVPEQEFRTGKDAFQCGSDSHLESRGGSCLCVQAEERPHVFLGHGPAIGPMRER